MSQPEQTKKGAGATTNNPAWQPPTPNRTDWQTTQQQSTAQQQTSLLQPAPSPTVTPTARPTEPQNQTAQNAEAAQKAQQNLSDWTKLGHPEYASKYLAPQLPEGSIVRGISVGDQGLQIQYVPSDYPEQLANLVTRGVGYGTAYDTKDVAWLNRNYPDVIAQERGRYATALIEAPEAFASGNVKQIASIAREFPELAIQQSNLKQQTDYAVAVQKYSADVADAYWLGGYGSAVGIKDIAFVNKNAPDALANAGYGKSYDVKYLASLAKQQPAPPTPGYGSTYDIKQVAAWAKTLPTPGYGTTYDIKDIAAWAKQQPTSQATAGVSDLAEWTLLGHPEYAGKYQLPLGFKAGSGEVESWLAAGGKIEGFHEGNIAPSNPLLAGIFIDPSKPEPYQKGLLYSVTPPPLTAGPATKGVNVVVEKPHWETSDPLFLATVNTASEINDYLSKPGYWMDIAGHPITPTGYQGLEVAAAIAEPTLAPEVLPAVTAKNILLAGGLSVGLGEALSYGTTGKLLGSEQVVQSALIGETMAVGSGAIMLGVAKVAPTVASSLLGRTGVSMAIGAGSGYGLSGGNIRQAGLGSLSALGFSGLGYAVDEGWLPVPKIGSVSVPLEGGEEATWKGLYLSRGENATPLIGVSSDVPEGATILSHGVGGEEAGYVPQSNIESAVTAKVMGEAGYSPDEIFKVTGIRSVMSVTQNVKSGYIEDFLPRETGTLSETGVSTVKDFVITNRSQVEELYGSFATKPQLRTDVEYSLEDVSALRTPADIDIQLKQEVGQVGAEEFTKNLAGELTQSGETVRVNPTRPTLIEAQVGENNWAHAIDIHYSGEPDADLAPEKAWGFKLDKPTTQIENIEVMGAGEQGLRKGVSILGFSEDQTLGPVEHRVKDIPDFFQVQRTLLSSLPSPNEEAEMTLAKLADVYGVSMADLSQTEGSTITERYSVSPSGSDVSPYMSGSPFLFSQSSGFASEPVKQSSSKGIMTLADSYDVSLGKQASSQKLSYAPLKSPSSYSSLIASSLVPLAYKPSSLKPSNYAKPSSFQLSPSVKPSQLSASPLASALASDFPSSSQKTSTGSVRASLKASDIRSSPIISPSEYPSASPSLSEYPSASGKGSPSLSSVLSDVPSISPSKSSSSKYPSLYEVPSPYDYPSPSTRASPSPSLSPSLSPSPSLSSVPSVSLSASPSPYPSPSSGYTSTNPTPRRNMFDWQKKKPKKRFGKAYYTSVFRGWPVRTGEQVLKLGNRNIAGELRRPDMGKPSTKRLEAQIKEERKSSKKYRGWGYPKIAKQETQHRHKLEAELKKRKQSGKRR